RDLFTCGRLTSYGDSLARPLRTGWIPGDRRGQAAIGATEAYRPGPRCGDRASRQGRPTAVRSVLDDQTDGGGPRGQPGARGAGLERPWYRTAPCRLLQDFNRSAVCRKIARRRGAL